jgi:hypothetical protein
MRLNFGRRTGKKAVRAVCDMDIQGAFLSIEDVWGNSGETECQRANFNPADNVAHNFGWTVYKWNKVFSRGSNA